MNAVESIELLLGTEIVPVFAGDDVYVRIVADIREKYREQGAVFPIVHLRDESGLTARQYQVVMNGEIVVDETLHQITEETMIEILTRLSHAFCDYYNTLAGVV